MSKERLEEIAYNVGVSLDGEKAIMSSDDYDFLYNYALQQAKRVQELEQDVREWEIVNEQWEKINTQIAEQNKRYREALEWYSENSPHGNIADEALEGEKHD